MNDRYNAKERAEAIEACALMASSCERDSEMPSHYYGDAIETDSRASELGRQALWALSGKHEDEREWWAAAEALLRDGWEPGDALEQIS